MKRSSILTVGFIVAATWLLTPASTAYGQLWRQFAHPNNPHLLKDIRNPDVPLSTPELLQGSGNITVSRPTLVILLEFNDVDFQSFHDDTFWRNLVFGNPRPGSRPSISEIIRENSNGRLLLTPAVAGDVHDGNADGVVEVRSTQDYSDLAIKVSEKRAECIVLADPLFDYYKYDTNPSDDQITTNELVIIEVFAMRWQADNANPNYQPGCDQHIGHADPPNCIQWPGGNTRPTIPAKINVDQNTQWPKQVYQYIAGQDEIANVGVFAHELGHSLFGHGDLYSRTGCQSTPTGYVCNGTWYPPPPGFLSLMWGGDPNYVTHLDPWAKIHLGFNKPLVVTHDGAYALYAAETERTFTRQDSEPEALIIYDPLRSDPYEEYFILENRNKAELPDQGLAVWLINEKGLPDTEVRIVDRLIRRGGHKVQMDSSLWDGINKVDGYDLTATSTPRNTNWTDDSRSYIEIYDISQAGPAMTFKVRMPPIFVDRSNTGTEHGTQAYPFNTVLEGVSAIPEFPRTIRIAGGSYPEKLVINTQCTLMGWRNGKAIIGQ